MTSQDEELRQQEISVTHILEHYKNHCEFSGYSVVEDSEFSIFCNHQRKDPFGLILLSYGAGVMARIFYSFPEKLSSDPMSLYSYANELNSILTFMKVCVRGVEDGKPFLLVNSVLEGEYSRKNFAIFLDNIDQDLNKFHSYPKTRDIWRTQDE